MKTPSEKFRLLLNRLSGQVFLVLLCFATAWAQTTQRPAGELSHANRTTLNGRSAVAGGTVFNNSRIRTAKQGGAVISLGKQGRIEVGADSELALRSFGDVVGGELVAGRTLVSAPQGVGISVLTTQGTILSETGVPSVLAVEQSPEQTRVVAHRGVAKIVVGTRVERLSEGEELTLNVRAKSGWQRRRLWTATALGAGSAAGVAAAVGRNVPPAVATTTAAKATFATLVNAGVNYSISLLSPPSRDPEIFFNTNITCRDHDNFLCRRKSAFIP